MIKKRQVLILTLAAVICLAVYINWRYTSSGLDTNNKEINNEEKNLGEAKFVDNTINPYFEEARLNRMETRDEAESMLTSIINNVNVGENEKQAAYNKIALLASATEMEGRIENLVKAKGFKECLTIIGEKSISIIVQTDGLTAEDAVKIKDIALSETDFSALDIKLIEIKNT